MGGIGEECAMFNGRIDYIPSVHASMQNEQPAISTSAIRVTVQYFQEVQRDARQGQDQILRSSIRHLRINPRHADKGNLYANKSLSCFNSSSHSSLVPTVILKQPSHPISPPL